MPHAMVVVEDTEHGVMFQCSICNQMCEFVHTAFGEPNPVGDAVLGWNTPENPEKWMGPCND